MPLFCYGIDIGTNSARLMLAEQVNGRIRSCRKILRTVRTGEGVNATHRLCDAAIDRTAAVMREFRQIMDEEHPELPVFCFATSAVRDAENAKDLLMIVKEETGLEIHILSGEQEAEIGYLGAVPEGTGGLIDIGGGSTEFVLGESGRIVYRHSFDAGTIRCKEMFGRAGDPEGVAATVSWAEGLFAELKDLPQTSFTGIGGTVTTVCAMLQEMREYDSQKIQGSRITATQVEALLKRITPMTVEERRNLPGIQPQRADIIPYGMAVLTAGMRVLALDELTVSDADNLEGYAIKFQTRINS